MTTYLYTAAELVVLIKQLDIELNTPFTQGRLDTGMSEQEWRVSMAEKRQQRDYYYRLWQQQVGNGGSVTELLPADDWIA